MEKGAAWHSRNASEDFRFRACTLRSGIVLLLAQARFDRAFCHDVALHAPMCELCFNIGPGIQGEAGRHLLEIPRATASVNLLTPNQCRNEFLSGDSFHYCSLWIEQGLFSDFLQEMDESASFFSVLGKGSLRAEQHGLREDESLLLSKIIAHMEDGSQKYNRLLLDSWALELTAINLSYLLGTERPLAISERDRSLAERAREALLTQLEQPLTIFELARRIGVSDWKLKRVFKAVHGQTIHDFQRDQRLARALFLLREKKYNVSESAYAVGYNNLSHFSEIFQSKYGFKPSQLKGN